MSRICKSTVITIDLPIHNKNAYLYIKTFKLFKCLYSLTLLKARDLNEDEKMYKSMLTYRAYITHNTTCSC